jgi:hypothetical protein
MAIDDQRMRLLVEVFLERGVEGRLVTWSLDLSPARIRPRAAAHHGRRPAHRHSRPVPARAGHDARVLGHDLTIRAPDLSLEMASGSAFVAETPDGPTAIVLVGRGRMHFAPADPAERTQVRIFAGSEALTTPFDALFIRVSPVGSSSGRSFPPARCARAGEPPDAPPRAVGVRRERRAHAPDRSVGPEPGPLVARAPGARHHRRSANAEATASSPTRGRSATPRTSRCSNGAAAATSPSTPRRRSSRRAGGSTARTISSITTSSSTTSTWPSRPTGRGSRARPGCA